MSRARLFHGADGISQDQTLPTTPLSRKRDGNVLSLISPFKENGAKYARTAVAVADAVKERKELGNKELVITSRNDRRFASVDTQSNFTSICLFIQDFLQQDEYFNATQQAYNDKLDYFRQEQQRIINVTEEILRFFTDVISRLKVQEDISVIKAEITAWHQAYLEDIKLLKRDIKDNVEAIIDNVSSALEIKHAKTRLPLLEIIDDSLTKLSKTINKAREQIKKINIKVESIPDPLCVNFSIVVDKQSGEQFCLVALSSPDKNIHLQQFLDQFIERFSIPECKFYLAAEAGRNYHKLLVHSSIHAKQGLPRNYYRDCAEKASYSTLTKYSHYNGKDIEVKEVYNFAFYPQPKPAIVGNDYIELALPQGHFVMKMIPPCADCKAILPAAQAMLDCATQAIAVSPPKVSSRRTLV